MWSLFGSSRFPESARIQVILLNFEENLKIKNTILLKMKLNVNVKLIPLRDHRSQ
jgi:hypothetical protein